MSLTSSPALRAHVRLLEQLKNRITTHYRKPRHIDRSGKNMTALDALTRSRNGRRGGVKVHATRTVGHSMRKRHG